MIKWTKETNKKKRQVAGNCYYWWYMKINYENVLWSKSVFALTKEDCIAFFELPNKNQLGGSSIQAGGSYKSKYLKYKNKYLELKRNIN